MNSKPVRLIVLCALGWALLAPAPVASAHPLGNFTINRYSRIDLASKRIRLRYIVDMAEIPAYQEMGAIDRNRDGHVEEAEGTSYLSQKVDVLRRGLNLRLNGIAVSLSPAAQQLTFPPGQGGLPTLRISADFEAQFSRSQGVYLLDYRDDNYADRLGWKEIVIRGGDGVAITQSTAADTDRSAELTAYPEDLLSSPLGQRQAQAAFEITAAGILPAAQAFEPAGVPSNVYDRSRDALAGLIAADELSAGFVLFALLAAFGLGAMHSLSPGHGKTVVGAYLVGSRGTMWHALFLGLTVTLTHTAGVFALGLITLFASQFILPERLYPWLSLGSGLLVVAIGLSLLVSRLRSAASPGAGHHHHHTGHDHHHEHDHDHSHIPNVVVGPAVTWRSLLALGVSGGLLPCPSALVVLLSAIALHRVAFGLLLIVAFSAGLAAVLTAIGLVLVYAGRRFARLNAPSRLVRLLPVGSALVVTALGIVIAAQAIAQVAS